jgi:flagella basal body P-ring formation protein FlgA
LLNKITLVVGLALLAALAAPAATAVETGEAIVDLMRTTYELDPAEYEIEITASQLKTRLVDPADLSFKPLSRKEPLGPFTVLVKITSDDDLIEKGQVRLRIKRFARVLVTTDKIGRHDLLNEQQFELKRVDVTSLREQPVSTMTGIVGQRSKRNLRLGSILTRTAMEPVPDIDVGREVTIVFTDTWGSVTAPGRSMQSGWIGGNLRVKNLATGKVISAQVISKKRVEVNP